MCSVRVFYFFFHSVHKLWEQGLAFATAAAAVVVSLFVPVLLHIQFKNIARAKEQIKMYFAYMRVCVVVLDTT